MSFISEVKKYLFSKYAVSGDGILNLEIDNTEDYSIYQNFSLIVSIDENLRNVNLSKYRTNQYNQHITKFFSFNSGGFFNDKKRKTKFDILSLFTGAGKFYQKKEYFDTLMANVGHNLKKGGYLFLSGLDGEKINEVMNRNVFISGKSRQKTAWTIQKNYIGDFNLNVSNFGKQIKVTYQESHKVHLKTLINVDWVVEIAKTHGLEIIEILPYKILYGRIENKPLLGRSEREFLFYNTALVFKKVE